ncbi:MAG: precorrin-3B C(17)-methyltransferase [Spirochaetaceae bacterium]|jgi:precorrin-3B C17-methyltransferase|nr:precorrin-3B C(17)-methyltransferase [Spirochaetaceae bacterium]
MKLYVIGIGPGDEKYLTPEAKAALDESGAVAGYPLYLDLIRPLIEGKRIFASPMRQEVERCRAALDSAAGGTVTALVCSGDSGVYGMAGLVCELAPEYPAVEVAAIPGITAALSGAALLGAPLTNDFAVVSLSDLLTPWETIVKRLEGAGAGDFVICLYNPASLKRRDYLAKACDILLRRRKPETICGAVRNAGRLAEQTRVMTLAELRTYEADMFTTIFVGNSATELIAGKMVQPRGYRH